MKAHKSYMRRQGSGWIVCHWDDTVQAYRESGEMPYHQARAAVGTANCTDPYCNKWTHAHYPGDILINGKVYGEHIGDTHHHKEAPHD